MKHLPITDAHVHFWDPATIRYGWLDGLEKLNRAFLPHDYAAATRSCEIKTLIFVESGCHPALSLAEINWIERLAKGEPRIQGIVAHAAVELGPGVREDLEQLASRPLVKGVRRLLQSESDPEFCLQNSFLQGLRLLAEFGFTFDVCIRAEQLPGVIRMAREVPEVTFVLDHCGKPDIRNRTFDPWAKNLQAFADLPNTVCKISGLTTEADLEHWQPADLKPYLQAAFRSFGFNRILFGSDWPVATLATTYEAWVNVVLDAANDASDQERLMLFGGNAERIYRV